MVEPVSWDVIVVGAGFAGVEVARRLGAAGVEVLLVDGNDYHQFQPLLYQVATSQAPTSDVARPLRSMFRQLSSVRVTVAEVTAVDPERRVVTLDDQTECAAGVLVLATGSQVNFFGIDGAAEHAHPLYSLEDAVRVGAATLDLLDAADRLSSPIRTLDLVVVGSGPTGVEFAGAVADNLSATVAAMYPGDMAGRTTVHLVDMVSTVLGPFSEDSRTYAQRMLERGGVRLHLGQAVTEVRDDAVVLDDGTRIPSRLTVWAGGLQGRDVLRGSGLPVGRGGRVDVNRDLTVEGLNGVYVLGDAANMTDTKGRQLPQLAAVARQAGRCVAGNVLADLIGEPHRPFAYRDKGIMAMIGRGSAVAEIGPRRWRLQGAGAFAAWLAVHAALLPGPWQRISAAADWTAAYLTRERPHAMVGHVRQALKRSERNPRRSVTP